MRFSRTASSAAQATSNGQADLRAATGRAHLHTHRLRQRRRANHGDQRPARALHHGNLEIGARKLSHQNGRRNPDGYQLLLPLHQRQADCDELSKNPGRVGEPSPAGKLCPGQPERRNAAGRRRLQAIAPPIASNSLMNERVDRDLGSKLLYSCRNSLSIRSSLQWALEACEASVQ